MLYGAVSVVFFGLPALTHLGRNCACGAGPDPTMFMWFLAWWPQALLHGLNPFFSNAVFAGDNLDIGGVAEVPGAAIAIAPVTLLFGPIVSFNVLMLAAPMLAAGFAFLLCRYVSRSFAASLVGGYLFGFSPYMLGHMLVHLNLVLTFPIPAGIHLVLRLIDGAIGRRRYVVLMALDLAALLLFSTELAAVFVALGATALAIAMAMIAEERSRLRGAIAPTLIAGVLAMLVTSPVMYHTLRGTTAGFNDFGNLYGGDALGFLVPSPIIALGGGSFGAVSRTFNGGNFAESGIYLGLPVVAILAWYFVTRWRAPCVRLLFAMLGLIVVLLLGSHLRIDGDPTIALPWRLLDKLPLVREVTPVRLGLYVYLIAALVVSMWLADRRDGALDTAKWLMAVLAILFILPTLRQGLWGAQHSNPAFFTTGQYKRYLRRDATVLILPWSWHGDGMLWQAETGTWFRTAGGYIGKLFPADYYGDPMRPALLDGRMAGAANRLPAFLGTHHVSAVIVDSADPGPWPAVLARIGLSGSRIGGVLFYRVPSAAHGSATVRA